MVADWSAHAIRRPMPYADTLPARQPKRVAAMHTNGGGTDDGSLYGWFARPGNTVCSHFQIMFDGTAEQYVPMSRQAYAQHQANDFVVSLEFQDEGDPARPLTGSQLDTAALIVAEIGVPPVVVGEYGSPEGYGWHSIYASWNTSAHACPGGVRLQQWHDLFAAGPPAPTPAMEGEPVNIITKSDGTAARILAVDATNGIKVYAVMSSTDLSAFKHMAPGAVVWSPLPTADYNNLVNQHGN
jgi:N-acetylmuramoyl-L-alanine amidase